MKYIKATMLACMFACVVVIQAHCQDGMQGGRGWLASGLYAGIRGQYRIPETTYSIGYDGSWFTIIATGDRIDLPTLGPMFGYGAFIGYASSENQREPAYVFSAAWSLAKGKGDSTIGGLEYVDHEICLVFEFLFPCRKGFAIIGQFGWDFEFFSVADGFLPYGGSREDLLVSSFIGLDGGFGLAYIVDRRLLIEAKAVARMFSDNIASGELLSDSLGGEIGRGEFSFELSVGWIF